MPRVKKPKSDTQQTLSRSKDTNQSASFSINNIWDRFSFTKRKTKQTVSERIRQQRSRDHVKSWIVVCTLTAFVVFSLIGVAIGLPQKLYDQAKTAFIRKSAHYGMDVKDVLVEGRKNAPLKNVLAAVNASLNTPILDYDLNVIRDRLLKIDWIKSVIVQRRLPNVIYIKIQERQPIALWQRKNVHYLVDSDGVVINSKIPAIFKDLPIVAGNDAPSQTPKIITLIQKFPAIQQRITAMVRIRERRWNLTLDKSVVIKLPDDKLEEALIRLSSIIEKNNLSPEFIVSVDLRLSGKIIVKMTDQAAKLLKAKKKVREKV